MLRIFNFNVVYHLFGWWYYRIDRSQDRSILDVTKWVLLPHWNIKKCTERLHCFIRLELNWFFTVMDFWFRTNVWMKIERIVSERYKTMVYYPIANLVFYSFFQVILPTTFTACSQGLNFLWRAPMSKRWVKLNELMNQLKRLKRVTRGFFYNRFLSNCILGSSCSRNICYGSTMLGLKSWTIWEEKEICNSIFSYFGRFLNILL